MAAAAPAQPAPSMGGGLDLAQLQSLLAGAQQQQAAPAPAPEPVAEESNDPMAGLDLSALGLGGGGGLGGLQQLAGLNLAQTSATSSNDNSE